MKINFKTKTTISIIMILIIAIATIVNAADTSNYSVGMSLTSNSKLKEGDTVTVNINLTSINAGAGIDTITAQLNYDKAVFEPITASNVSGSNAWTPSYSEVSNMMTFIKNSKVKAAETVATISFKVKSTVSADSTTITLKDITASGGRVVDGGTGDITVNNALLTLSKVKEPTGTTQKPENNTIENNAVENNTVINNSVTNNTIKNTTVIKDTTATNKVTLPATGIAESGIIAIIVIAIVAIFSYVQYKKNAKYIK